MNKQTPHAPPLEDAIQKTVADCQRYREKLYWRCKLYFKERPEYAEDCVQEAYVELLRALQAGRQIYNYEAWLFRVALQKGQEMIREEKMRREVEIVDESNNKIFSMEQAGIYHQVFPAEAEPELSDSEIRRRAVAVLSKLSATERRIYYEHYVRNKPLRQIAEEMDITENAISKRHVRLKQKIKKTIQSIK